MVTNGEASGEEILPIIRNGQEEKDPLLPEDAAVEDRVPQTFRVPNKNEETSLKGKGLYFEEGQNKG